MLDKTEWSQELRTGSPKINLLDILISPSYFKRKCVVQQMRISIFISGLIMVRRYHKKSDPLSHPVWKILQTFDMLDSYKFVVNFTYSSFQLSIENKLCLLWLCRIASLCYWPANLAPLFQPTTNGKQTQDIKY